MFAEKFRKLLDRNEQFRDRDSQCDQIWRNFETLVKFYEYLETF